MRRQAFEALVRDAVQELPDFFLDIMRNVDVQVRRWPTSHQRREAELEEDETLLGLYVGVPLTERYDERMEDRLGYVAPRVMAERLAARLDDRSAVILDVGCGTGLTCQYLAERGFTTFDGIDITPEMIAKSRERGIYRDLYQADITEPLDMADAAYDAAISSGARRMPS